MHARVSAKLRLHNIWRGRGDIIHGGDSIRRFVRGGGVSGHSCTSRSQYSLLKYIATRARPCSAAREQKLGLIVSVAPLNV